MATRKERRKRYNGKKVRAGIEGAITRTRMAGFTVEEIEISYQAWRLLNIQYGTDELEEIMGVPVVVGDMETPYEFGILTDNPLHGTKHDALQHMREAIE